MGVLIKSSDEKVDPDGKPLSEADVLAGVNTVDGDGNKVVVDPNRPKPDESGDDKLIGGKFKSQEDLLNAYQELERKQGADPDKKPAKPIEPLHDATIKKAEEAGLDIAAIENEWGEKGELSDETYGKLAKKGFDRVTVDTIIEGRKAIAQRFVGELSKVTGGADQMKQILEWSVTNLSEAEQEAYNSVVNGGDLETSKLALAGLLARYTKETGSPPDLVDGGESRPSAGGPKPFTSRAQVTEAMRDPRYKKDSAYQKAVSDRLAVSDVF